MCQTRIGIGLIAIGLFSWALGCSLPGNNKNPFAYSTYAKQNAPAHSGPPLTAFDKESLLKGAGPVDADAPQDFKETNTGLRYRILRKSQGSKPNPSNMVTVDYRGWLDDGTEFDSSYKKGQPLAIPLNGVIPGWTEGMQLIGTGGMVELWIPSVLGYGSRGSGASVPPNATLHFIVELHDVT